MELRILVDETSREVYDCSRRRRNPELTQHRRGDPFIYYDAGMLRIVCELNDVRASVCGFNEMRLRTPAHFPDETASFDIDGGAAIQLI